MIAKRRARKQPLIRSNSLATILTRAQSSTDGVSEVQSGAFSDLGHTTPLSKNAIPAPQYELTMYLRQLTTLHVAGILTDEEFSAASCRLLGS
jgi:hypothetical protein